LLASNRRAELQRGSRIELAERTAWYDVEARLGGAAGERLAGARRDDRTMSATRELGGEPERLSLTAAPALLRVDVQYAKSHRAQLPRLGVEAQGACW
jgi:hypothetical protein